jgi:hypothetical protein
MSPAAAAIALVRNYGAGAVTALWDIGKTLALALIVSAVVAVADEPHSVWIGSGPRNGGCPASKAQAHLGFMRRAGVSDIPVVRLRNREEIYFLVGILNHLVMRDRTFSLVDSLSCRNRATDHISFSKLKRRIFGRPLNYTPSFQDQISSWCRTIVLKYETNPVLVSIVDDCSEQDRLWDGDKCPVGLLQKIELSLKSAHLSLIGSGQILHRRGLADCGLRQVACGFGKVAGVYPADPHLMPLQKRSPELQQSCDEKETREDGNSPRPSDQVAVKLVWIACDLSGAVAASCLAVWNAVFWGYWRGWWLYSLLGMCGSAVFVFNFFIQILELSVQTA